LNAVVIRLEAGIEVPAVVYLSPQPWPVEALAPDSWLVLDGDCADDRVGLFVAALAARIEVQPPGGRDEVVNALLAEESLIAAGGLRVRDSTSGTVVTPGCCAGLADWRDWTQVLTGGSPWLGHDPGPEVSVVGDELRVWQDGGPSLYRGRWAGLHIDLPHRALPELLRSAQRDLIGFLHALTGWAKRVGLQQRGTALVEAIDENFVITAPLDVQPPR
jgi:hypothetical protein